MSDGVTIDAGALSALVAGIFAAVGVPDEAAGYVAGLLVEADEEGIPSHGVMLVPMYVDRIKHGSISLETEGAVVSDRGSAVVLDAGNVLGQLTARQATAIALAKAKEFGLGAVAVRNGFHFGATGRYALDLAAQGCAAFVMCNTRPLLPAPGGAEAMVGNNPIAIAIPTAGDGPPALVDMATSASAMGKIRMADSAGKSIPAGWATDADGRPTTDPGAAIKGMLLPAGGAKGFGLAFMIDLLCGGLADGGIGASVTPLYGDPSVPYNCAHLFVAIDVGHFRDPVEAATAARNAVERVRASKPAPGVDRVMSPGEPAWQAKRQNFGRCTLNAAVWAELSSLSVELGVSAPEPVEATN